MAQTTLPNSNVPVLNQQGVLFANPWFIYLQGLFKAVGAKFSLNLSGILSVNTTPASNTNAAETDLMIYSLQANTLQNNGDILTIKAAGFFATNGNNKTLKLKFGSQTIIDTGAVAANGTSWEINSTITRLSPTSQEISATAISNNTIFSARVVGTQDLTTTFAIKCTGQGSITNDLTETALIIGLTSNN